VSAPLILTPDLRFSDLATRLESLGFRRDPSVRPFTPDTLAGEPELAAWTLGDEEARVTYTFNPVVSLRVLTPSAVNEQTRAELAAALPCLDVAAVARLLSERDPRKILLGLLATKILAAPALRDQVGALRAHPSRPVSEAARAAWDALPEDTEAAARQTALILLDQLCREAAPVLAALGGPDSERVLEALRPQPEDFARLFRAEIAEEAQKAYEPIWRHPPRVDAMSVGVTLKVFACPARMLDTDNELSRRFPGGYRALAPWLVPDRIWFVWRYLRPGEAAGVRYDGLVRVNDRWVWLPKPYRVVGEILRSRGD